MLRRDNLENFRERNPGEKKVIFVPYFGNVMENPEKVWNFVVRLKCAENAINYGS